MTLAQRAFVLALSIFVVVAIVSTKGMRAEAQESVEKAKRAYELTTRLDLDYAKRELEGADPDRPEVSVTKGRLAIYTGECDEAVAVLGRRELSADDDARQLADVARGCARVTAAVITKTDEARAIEVKFQDEHDVALFPLLVETIVLARAKLTEDLGVDWPKPTRFIVVRDHLSLSAMTGLPYESNPRDAHGLRAPREPPREPASGDGGRAPPRHRRDRRVRHGARLPQPRSRQGGPAPRARQTRRDRAPANGLVLLPLYQGLGSDGFFWGRAVSTARLVASEALRSLDLDRFIDWLPGVARDRERPTRLVIDTKIARFYPLDVFHTLGYRRVRERDGELTVERQPG